MADGTLLYRFCLDSIRQRLGTNKFRTTDAVTRSEGAEATNRLARWVSINNLAAHGDGYGAGEGDGVRRYASAWVGQLESQAASGATPSCEASIKILTTPCYISILGNFAPWPRGLGGLPPGRCG